MRSPTEYCLLLRSPPDAALVDKVFELVWRFDFRGPGFALIDAGPEVDSHTLRSWMVELKGHLSTRCMKRTGNQLRYRSMARFDQQETTKFHLDGAPEQSMLMLGYEPSRVRSRLFLADYTRAAFDRGITPRQFLQDFNPMYRHGEEELASRITELPEPANGHARIVLINNSSLPFSESRTNPLGVMHKAEILNAMPSERRIVNSTMLVVGDDAEPGRDQQQEFITTDEISQKVY
jgi:hypothetical protein